MTSEPNNAESASSQVAQSATDSLSQKLPKTISGRLVKKLVAYIGEPLQVLAFSLMGEELALQVWEEIQETIAYALILQLPDLIGTLLLQENFSGFNVCQDKNPLDVSRYACYTVVGSDFLLWLSIAGRIIGRFVGGILNSINRSR